ncbi:hypothetical protein HK102_013975, partial [Quaeritorhiza haematococci]
MDMPSSLLAPFTPAIKDSVALLTSLTDEDDGRKSKQLPPPAPVIEKDGQSIFFNPNMASVLGTAPVMNSVMSASAGNAGTMVPLLQTEKGTFYYVPPGCMVLLQPDSNMASQIPSTGVPSLTSQTTSAVVSASTPPPSVTSVLPSPPMSTTLPAATAPATTSSCSSIGFWDLEALNHDMPPLSPPASVTTQDSRSTATPRLSMNTPSPPSPLSLCDSLSESQYPSMIDEFFKDLDMDSPAASTIMIPSITSTSTSSFEPEPAVITQNLDLDPLFW